jgi:ATP-dependent protease ClpP protease subunit
MVTMAGGAVDSLAQVSIEAAVRPADEHHLTIAGRIDVHALYSFVRLTGDPRLSQASQRVLKLDSVGGSVTAAMAIGHLVRDRGFTTIVEEGKECLSACVLILAAGVERVISSRKVGVHRPRHGVALAASSTATQTQVNDQLIEDMRRYLGTMGMDDGLFTSMVAVPPDRMKVLSRVEMHSFGLLAKDIHAPQTAGPRGGGAQSKLTSVKPHAVGARNKAHARSRNSRPREHVAVRHVKDFKRGRREARRPTIVRASKTRRGATRNGTRVNVNAFANFG